MRKAYVFLLAAALLVFGLAARATVFGGVQGIVHDPQHRPIPGAQVQLKSATSDWSQQTQTNQDGEFEFATVPYRRLHRYGNGLRISEHAAEHYRHVRVVAGPSFPARDRNRKPDSDRFCASPGGKCRFGYFDHPPGPQRHRPDPRRGSFQ